MANFKEIVRQIGKGNNVKQYLSEYISKSMDMYHRYAKLRMMMEYYTYYEVCAEGLNAHLKQADDTVDFINETVKRLFVDKEYQRETLVESVHKQRNLVMQKMQIITSYIDELIVYEYILNRMQYRFEPFQMEMTEEAFAEKVIRYIFSTKDNVIINENIKSVLGQLPVRMAKGKYYDLVKDSLSVYKGADKSSVENYLYMFRTCATLYEPEGKDEYFTEFAALTKELSDLDYENLTEADYKKYAGNITRAAEELKEISDLYMSLQQILNELYAIILSAPEEEKEDERNAEKKAEFVIGGVYRLFQGIQDDYFALKEETPGTDEEKLEVLGETFVSIEGSQESLYESICLLEAVLEDVRRNGEAELKELGLSGQAEDLTVIAKLLSSSIFIDLEEEENEEKADASYLEEVTEELTGQLDALFHEKGRYVKRAVMANTLEKMPVFFTSPQEVADYIQSSLEKCSDAAERYASMQLIELLMEENG